MQYQHVEKLAHSLANCVQVFKYMCTYGRIYLQVIHRQLADTVCQLADLPLKAVKVPLSYIQYVHPAS